MSSSGNKIVLTSSAVGLKSAICVFPFPSKLRLSYNSAVFTDLAFFNLARYATVL